MGDCNTGLYPLKFAPIFKQMIWGSESWGLSGVPGSVSVVSIGALHGRKIPDIVHEYKGLLVGEKNYLRFGDEFPLLIKFIDASLDLSVQVHPNDELALKRHGKRGKSEMWYVTGALPGARLHAGFARNISPDEYERKVEDGTIGIRITREEFTVSLLHRFNRPLVSTSANISGMPSPRFYAEVSDEIRNAVDYIVDYRRNDHQPVAPSSILKIGMKGEIEIIRK